MNTVTRKMAGPATPSVFNPSKEYLLQITAYNYYRSDCLLVLDELSQVDPKAGDFTRW